MSCESKLRRISDRDEKSDERVTNCLCVTSKIDDMEFNTTKI